MAQTAIVTGASSGFGFEMATLLDAQGYDVVLVARSAAALEQLAGTLRSARIVPLDLSQHDAPEALFREVPSTDLLINNAGFGECGPFAKANQDRARDMIEVNCVAVTALTGRYLPGMLERGAGHILNVASTAAFQPGPEMAVYYATKAYVLSFSEAIAEEVRGSGVRVTAFCPGAFSSGFAETAHAQTTRLFKGRKLPTSAAMAAAAWSAMQSGAVVAVPGVTNKIGAFLPRLSPRPVLRRAVHFIQRDVPE